MHNPVNIYLFKANNRNTRKRCGICSELTIKTPERHQWRQWRRSDVFIGNFEHIPHLFIVFLLLLWRSRILDGKCFLKNFPYICFSFKKMILWKKVCIFTFLHPLKSSWHLTLSKSTPCSVVLNFTFNLLFRREKAQRKTCSNSTKLHWNIGIIGKCIILKALLKWLFPFSKPFDDFSSQFQPDPRWSWTKLKKRIFCTPSFGMKFIYIYMTFGFTLDLFVLSRNGDTTSIKANAERSF